MITTSLNQYSKEKINTYVQKYEKLKSVLKLQYGTH